MSHAEERFVPLEYVRLAPDEMCARAEALREDLALRRSVRHFADEPLPDGLLDACIAVAGTAPSGANLQPWTFAVVTDPEVKGRIREAAEAEERENYGRRMTDEWRAVLRPLGTDASKPFLEVAPALIVVFRQAFGVGADGAHHKYYYTQESVGIAVGMLLAALQRAGLAALTHTPSPMGFLERILERPENERAFLLIPVGYPVEGCEVPAIERKGLEEIRVQI